MFFNKLASTNSDSYNQALKINANQLLANQCLSRVDQLDPITQYEEIINELLQAIHYQSETAAEQLINIIFASTKEIKLGKVLSFLTERATENPAAAYSLSMIYAGRYEENLNKDILYPLLENKDLKQRILITIIFAKQAIKLGSDKARRFLCKAFWEGQGCINPDESKWFELNRELAAQGNQCAAFSLGCYLLRISPDGQLINETIAKIFKIPADQIQGMNYLFKATTGNDTGLAYRAINYLSSYQFNPPISILSEFKAQIKNENQILALYAAFAVCPKENLPNFIEIPLSKFTDIMSKERKSHMDTLNYLEIALIGNNKRWKKIATYFNEHLMNVKTENHSFKRQRF